jgi:TolB-like protein
VRSRRRFEAPSIVALALTCALAAPAAGQSGHKATIAVLPFELAGPVVHLDDPFETTVLQDVFNRVLVNTRKFVVVDRTRLKRLRDEQRFGGSGLVDAASRARVGRILGAQYLVMGTVFDYSVSPPREMAYGSGWTRPVRISVEVQVVDSGSGQIVSARKAEATTQVRVPDASAAGAIPRAALEQAAEQVASQSLNAILDVAYPIKVIEVVGDKVRLNRGQDGGLKAGTTLRCFAAGRKLYDPDTKELLGSAEQDAGTVEVTEVLAKMTVARVVDRASVAVGDTCRLDQVAENEAGRHRAPPPSGPIHSY